MNTTHIKAKDLKIGDNVWGHNLVKTIVFFKDIVEVNGEWTATINEELMVTNR